MTWSARQYSAFEQERTRPVRDLVAGLPEHEVHKAVDLGCGPGNSTEVLIDRFADAQVRGLDSSEDMVEAARKRLPDHRFEVADISSWNPDETFDVILANASLQWVPDHETLYPRLVQKLSDHGSLAVQTPDNLAEPAHLLARELADNGPWAGKLTQTRPLPRHDAHWYYALLTPHCTRVDVWRTTYYHVLAGGAQAVVEWFKGTALRPYLAALDESEQAEFLSRYTAAIAKAYPAVPGGAVLLPFPRLFVVASR